MRQILSFVAVFLTGLLFSFPVEPDDQLNLFSLESDPMAEGVDTNINLPYQSVEVDDMFSSIEPTEPDEFAFNDPNNPILFSDGASSTVSQCVGESMEPINVARSLDSFQPFDIAAKQDGFCLDDGQEKSLIKLQFPTLDNLFNLNKPKPEGEIPPLNEMLRIPYCIANNAKVVCCLTKKWNLTWGRCKFYIFWDPDCQDAQNLGCCANIDENGIGTDCGPAVFEVVR